MKSESFVLITESLQLLQTLVSSGGMISAGSSVEGSSGSLVSGPSKTGVISRVHVAALARLEITRRWIVPDICTGQELL